MKGGKNPVPVQRSLVGVQLPEVGKDGFRRIQPREMLLHVGEGIHVCTDHPGCGASLQPEQPYWAFRGEALAVAVAAAGGLQQRIQPSLLPVRRREVHVHTCLNE